MIIAGFDLSLTSPGLCRVDTVTKTFTTQAFKPPKGYTEGHPRLDWIISRVEENAHGAALACVEEPAYAAKGEGGHALAGLWWLAVHELWKMSVPVAVVNVGSLKLYATGNGSAGKDLIMLVTGRRFPAFEGNNDAADALHLACMGAEHVGAPIIDVTAKQRAALAKVTWPQGAA